MADETPAEEPNTELPSRTESSNLPDDLLTEPIPIIPQPSVEGEDLDAEPETATHEPDEGAAGEPTVDEPEPTVDEPESIEAEALTEDADEPADPSLTADAEAAVNEDAPEDLEAVTSPEAVTSASVTASAEVTEILPAIPAPLQPSATPDVQEIKETPLMAPRRRRRGLLVAAASVLGLGIAYAGLAWFVADRVPSDTTVAGVDISGLERQAAIERLETTLADVMTEDISVELGDAQSAIAVVDAGLGVDIPGTVDELVGFTLNPSVLASHLLGYGVHEPILQIDPDSLKAALAAIAGDLNVAPIEGELALVDGEVHEVPPEDGLAVDIDAAVPVIVTQWLEGARPIALPEQIEAPTMDAQKLQQTREQVIDPLFSADIPLTVNEHSADVPKDTIIAAASLHLEGSSYELHLDPEPLLETVQGLFPQLGESPVDAYFEFRDGKPVIVPAVAGAGINANDLAQVLTRAATRTGAERHATLELETTKASFSTEDAEALGITERVSYYSTPVPYDPQRTKNLLNGAKKLTGVLVKPGETFSLIETFGPMTLANGYVESGVVVNGFEGKAMGGGLSQMSTTVFNAAFEAGMEDVVHQPHSRHFTRYPEGREATMFTPDLDMKWRNNTPYGVLVQSWIDDRAHVALWSTKYWDTQITTGPRTNFTAPQTVYNTNPRCIPERGGSSGFTVTVHRVVSKDGVRNDQYSRSYTHTYQPWNHVVCGEKPKPTPPESED